MAEEMSSFDLMNFIQNNSLQYINTTILTSLKSKLIKFI